MRVARLANFTSWANNKNSDSNNNNSCVCVCVAVICEQKARMLCSIVINNWTLPYRFFSWDVSIVPINVDT